MDPGFDPDFGPGDDLFRKLVATIDPRCGKCGLYFKPKMEIVNRPGCPRGILFKCHGQEDFLEVSEASLRVPKRFKGFMPFMGGLSKRQRDQIEAERRKEREALAAAVTKSRTQQLSDDQRAKLDAELMRPGKVRPIAPGVKYTSPTTPAPPSGIQGFIQKLMDGLSREEAIKFANSSPEPTPKPKPKPIELIVTNKPRIISLDD